jgi:GNAT superfamily N-acetyltransferase
MSDPTASQVTVRRAGRDDVPAIVRLLADDTLGATREQNTDPLPQFYWDAFDRIATHHGNELMVAELNGEVVGTLQLTVIPGMSRKGMIRGQIEGVRVSSTHRGKRIGEVMMNVAIERARERGCTTVQLTTDTRRVDAHRFYERLGFEATHLGMKKSIATIALMVLAALGFTSRQAGAQKATRDSVIATVNEFFRAMTAHDSATLNRVQMPGGVHFSARVSGDTVAINHGTVEAFAQRMATMTDTYVERMWDPTVMLHGPLAVVWAPYDIHRNKEFVHCGVDSFTLMRDHNVWRIATIAYTAEPQGCKGAKRERGEGTG